MATPTPNSLKRIQSVLRIRDLLMMVPFFAAILLMSPMLDFLGFEAMIGGVPARILQLFGGWLLLIVVVAVLNARLKALGEGAID